MSILTRTLASISVLALLCVVIVLIMLEPSDTAEGEFEGWFERTSGESFDKVLKDAWSQAFEKSWGEMFRNDFDEASKKRFKESFWAAFQESFKRVLNETKREASDEDSGQEVSMREEEGVSYDGDQISWKDRLTFDESAADLDRLELDTINGSVEIKGADTDTVHIVAFRVVRSIDKEKGEAYREEFRPIVRRKGSTLVVQTHRPEKNKSRPRYIKEARMAYEVSLPSRFGVHAKTINGSVKMKEIQSESSLHTVNGKIELTASEGLRGGVHAETVNGEIRVHAPRLTNESNLETVNGSVEVTASNVFEGELRAKTVNGSIRLHVPHDASFHLRANAAMSGSIHTDWGKPGKSRKLFGKSFEVDVNGGGEGRIALETLNGSIRVEKVD